MPTRTTPWPAGTPCWADNHVPDLDIASDFYGAVLGWRIDVPDPGAGNFACARLDGRPVAGFLVGVEGAPPEWHIFFATDDIDATAEATTEHGGATVFGPHAVPVDRGSFYLATDPVGAVFGAWQGRDLAGTGVYGEHGSLVWPDLRSTDPLTAQAFYSPVLGVSTRPIGKAGPHYALFSPSDDDRAPLGGIGPQSTPGEKNRWVVSFAVDDVNEALAAATRHGGTLAGQSRDTRFGRIAELCDPFGAGFSIITPVDPAPDR